MLNATNDPPPSPVLAELCVVNCVAVVTTTYVYMYLYMTAGTMGGKFKIQVLQRFAMCEIHSSCVLCLMCTLEKNVLCV